MNWFGLTRVINSHLRWVLDFFTWLKNGGRWSLTPPSAKTQILISLKPFRITKLRTATFYDWSTVYQIFINCEYDIDLTSRYFQLGNGNQVEQSKSKLILDLGANIGVAAVYFSIVFPDSHIVCLEPASGNLNLLKTNTKGLNNIEILHGAIGSQDGELSLFDPGIGNNGFRTFGPQVDEVERVKSYSVHTVLELFPSSEPFLIKIDIEGAEKQLFSENTDWIDRFKVIIIEIHDWMLPGESISSNLLAALGGRNRDLLFKGENLFSIRND
jgi:FkbM family methyltransferase